VTDRVTDIVAKFRWLDGKTVVTKPYASIDECLLLIRLKRELAKADGEKVSGTFVDPPSPDHVFSANWGKRGRDSYSSGFDGFRGRPRAQSGIKRVASPFPPPAELAGIFDRLGTNARSWQAKMKKLRASRLLGRVFAASQAKLEEIAERLNVRYVVNLSRCPAR
jgi:hypothetical protein